MKRVHLRSLIVQVVGEMTFFDYLLTIYHCTCEINTTQNDCPLELAPKVSTQSTTACFRLGQHHASTTCCSFKKPLIGKHC